MQEVSALEVNDLCKDYGSFKLSNVSFSLPKGYIMGFIGRNGAGKSTTLKSIMRSVTPDSGSVKIFGEDISKNETEVKQKIAFSLGTFESFPRSKADDVAKVYASFYNAFDFQKYEQLKRRFNLDGGKKLREMSAGMRVKFSVALAMSHDARLYIFDEPTSGLDPVSRDEMLDLFAEIIEDGERSVLFSTHITSDLDKCADYIVLIDNGSVCIGGVKDEILDSFTLIGGEEISEEIKGKAIGYKSSKLNFTALVRTADLPLVGVKTQTRPDIEQLMIYFSKRGDRQ